MLKRPVGSSAAYEREPKALPELPTAPSKQPAAKPEEVPRPRPKPDRTALTKAEAALAALDQRRKGEEAALRVRQEELDTEKAEAQAAFARQRRVASEAVASAQAAYRQAGGRDPHLLASR